MSAAESSHEADPNLSAVIDISAAGETDTDAQIATRGCTDRAHAVANLRAVRVPVPVARALLVGVCRWELR